VWKDVRARPALPFGSLFRMRGSSLLFDLDGTLADSLPLCLHAHRTSLLRHAGRVFGDREIAAEFGKTEEGMFRRLVPAAWEACLATYEEEYERAHHLCPAPFPGVVDLLTRLRQSGLRLGLVTGKGQKSARITLGKLGLSPLFDEVRTGSPQGDVKAEHIVELTRTFGVSLDRTAYVGDFVADVRAARAAGVLALAAAWAPGVDAQALAAARPDALFRSLGELDSWIESWLGSSGAVGGGEALAGRRG